MHLSSDTDSTKLFRDINCNESVKQQSKFILNQRNKYIIQSGQYGTIVINLE